MVAITIARAPETTPGANQFFRERTTGTYPPLATATLAPFKCGSWLDVGTTRKHKPNEDSLVAFEGTCIYNGELLPFGLFVVADGMGGYAHGQDASYLAVQTVLRSVLPNVAGSEE